MIYENHAKEKLLHLYMDIIAICMCRNRATIDGNWPILHMRVYADFHHHCDRATRPTRPLKFFLYSFYHSNHGYIL